ncbi:hypothetical protein FRB95_006431 [Tulasnella sp. JGI-2019a]|nr:hypothetical protein FRB95_006431 [Tulasnella sp. JGI-2019a]
MLRKGLDDPSSVSVLHQHLAHPPTSDPVSTPFAFFMPQSSNSSSDVAVAPRALSGRNISHLTTVDHGSSTPMSDASQAQTPSLHRLPAQHQQQSSSTADRNHQSQSGSNPGSWTADPTMLSQPFSPRMALSTSAHHHNTHHHHGFAPTPATTTPAYLTSPPGTTAALAQRNKLLLQTSSLPQRRGSFGPTSAGTQSGPTTMSSQPATPQSATASLPGSPPVVPSDQPQKARPNSLGGSMGSIRKKRNVGSSSSLSTSVPMTHQFAMPQLPNFPSLQRSDSSISAAGAQPMNPNFGSLPSTSGFTDHRASILSNSSGEGLGSLLGGGSSSLGGGPDYMSSPVSQMSDQLAGIWHTDLAANTSFDTTHLTPGTSSLPQTHSRTRSFNSSNPTLYPGYPSSNAMDLPAPFNTAHVQGGNARPNHSLDPSSEVHHPMSPTKSHTVPPSLHMSPFQTGLGVPAAAHATDSTMMYIMNQYRRSAAASPSGMSDLIADDVYASGASPDMGMTHHISPPQNGGGGGHARHSSTSSLTGSSGGNESVVVTTTRNHIQRVESLTRNMMALGLNRAEAEAAAERASASVDDRVIGPDEEKVDLGQLREMIAKGKVSIGDAIARVAAATIGASGTNRTSPKLGPLPTTSVATVGTPLGTVKEEQEPDYRGFNGLEDARGRSSEKGSRIKPVKIVGFGEEEDLDDFASQVTMDWRSISRSRSRAPDGMEWRSDSRSRTGSAANLAGSATNQWIHTNESHSHALLQQEDVKHLVGNNNDMIGFAGLGMDGNKLSRVASNQKFSMPISIPGSTVFKSPTNERGLKVEPGQAGATSSLNGHGRPKHASESGPIDTPGHIELPSLTTQHQARPSLTNFQHHPNFSGFAINGFHPSSLPATGLYELEATANQDTSPPGPWPQEKKHMFPKHVRKTSFDHTVSRSGIMGDAGGRHQVNGRPIGPDSSLGKRRADIAPHMDSYRGDDLTGTFDQSWANPDQPSNNSESGFPSAPFTFSVPNTYDGYDGTGNGGGYDKGANGGQGTVLFPRSGMSFDPLALVRMPPSPPDYPGQNGSMDPNQVLSGLPHSFDGSFPMMGMYGQMDGAGMDPYLQTFNTVDPTQILGTPGKNGDPSGTFEPSPPGWGSGSTPSSTASPEPTYATSAPSGSHMMVNASTANRGTGRPIRKLSGASRLPHGVMMKKEEGFDGGSALAGSSTVIALPNSTRGSQGSGSSGTPASGMGEDGADATSGTMCTNCGTTNTPLWRRDPEGNPLCNACGLFFKLHGVTRPLTLKTDVIKKRNRASNNLGSRKSTGSSGVGAAVSAIKATTVGVERNKSRGSFSQTIPRPTISPALPAVLSSGSMKRQRRASVANPSSR